MRITPIYRKGGFHHPLHLIISKFSRRMIAGAEPAFTLPLASLLLLEALYICIVYIFIYFEASLIRRHRVPVPLEYLVAIVIRMTKRYPKYRALSPLVS